MDMGKVKEKRRNIFEIERRDDFANEFAIFFEDVVKSVVGTSSGKTMKMMEYLEYCMRYWPYRRAATSINDYLLQINVDMTNPKSDIDLMLIMELLINLLHFANKMDEMDRNHLEISWGTSDDMQKETGRLLQNADYILEQCCNMQVRLGDYKEGISEPQYYICKRDADVDAAVESAPELANLLLGYMDVRNEKDKEYKEKVLTEIYRYLEPKRDKLKKSFVGAISEEFFAAMNKCDIRHNKGVQVKLHYTKRKALYDNLFRMALFVLQSEDVVKYKDEVKALRENGEKKEKS